MVRHLRNRRSSSVYTIRCERKRQWRSSRFWLHREFLGMAVAEPAALCPVHRIHEVQRRVNQLLRSRAQSEQEIQGLPGGGGSLFKTPPGTGRNTKKKNAVEHT